MSGELSRELLYKALSFGTVTTFCDKVVECAIRDVRASVPHNNCEEAALGELIETYPILIINDIVRAIRNHHDVAAGQEPVPVATSLDRAVELALFASNIEWLQEHRFSATLVFELGVSRTGHANAVFRFDNEQNMAHKFGGTAVDRYSVAAQVVRPVAFQLIHELLLRFDELIAPAQQVSERTQRKQKRDLRRALGVDS